jgi:hypothetical protein
VQFTIADLESRNGTRLAGLPLLAAADVPAQAVVDFGDEAQFEIYRTDDVVALRCNKGRDRGLVVVIAPPDQPVALTPWGVAVQVEFRNGRPWLSPLAAGERVVFADQALGAVAVQLIRSDTFTVGAALYEVE